MLIAGVDEVGRGPLAGPVVAAVVILDDDNPIDGLKDSKKLTKKNRERLYQDIVEKAKHYAFGECSPAEIDSINILQASLLAMKRAVDNLKVIPDFIQVDGNKLPSWQYKSEAIIKGDTKIEAISAASILAKVARDNMMLKYDKLYPEYGFAKHNAYPTKFHIEAVKKYGILDFYRKTFKPIRHMLDKN